MFGIFRSGTQVAGNGTKVQATGSTTAIPLQDWFAQRVNLKAYGAVGDGIADDTTALSAWSADVATGGSGYIPSGDYRTSTPLRFTSPVVIVADPGARISLTAAADYVLELDFTAGGAFWDYGSTLRDLVLDGRGFAVDGLSLKGVISATFDDIRATNVTRAGFHLWWAQTCQFKNPTVSGSVEAFTTTPTNGLLVDTASCSANVFVNPAFEHVSGSGIKGVSLVNSVFLNGTSEGNAIGLELGETGPSSLTAIGNSVIGMDLEVNSTSDIVLRATASNNDFFGLKSGFSSPAVQLIGSRSNSFVGGITSGFTLDASSDYNRIAGVSLLGVGATVSDSGSNNTITDVFNVSTAAFRKPTTNGRLIYSVSVSADRGDSNQTITAGTDAPIQRWATALTADRTVTLSTTGAVNGDAFTVKRSGGDTGGPWNLNVGTGPLKALLAGEWCDVVYNGSAWELLRHGTL